MASISTDLDFAEYAVDQTGHYRLAIDDWYIDTLNGTSLAEREAFVSRIVIGRAKPATDGRAKTGHFEKAEIRPLSLASGSRRERTMEWRINSRWPKFKQFWHLREVDGRTATSPGNWAFTARRLDAIFASVRPGIQNRPARPSGRKALYPR